jgi:2-hydroxychromene-2-carboxylate isomerase
MAFSQGWGKAFTRAAYRQWFLKREDISEDTALAGVLAALGKDPAATLAQAEAPAVHEALAAQTQAARELGIFGAPTFAVGREIFWGDDRLDDAIAWHRGTG